MTNLTISEDPGEEFALQGLDTVTNLRGNIIVRYDDVTKVHVLPEPGTFTIQIATRDLTVEMDFKDADSVREALGVFETKKVLDVNSEPFQAIRIKPLVENRENTETHTER